MKNKLQKNRYSTTFGVDPNFAVYLFPVYSNLEFFYPVLNM